jgi:hypothetical protein
MQRRLKKSMGEVTDEVLQIRQKLKSIFPEYFAEYLEAKKKNQAAFFSAPEKTSRWLSRHQSEFAVAYYHKSKYPVCLTERARVK